MYLQLWQLSMLSVRLQHRHRLHLCLSDSELCPKQWMSFPSDGLQWSAHAVHDRSETLHRWKEYRFPSGHWLIYDLRFPVLHSRSGGNRLMQSHLFRRSVHRVHLQLFLHKHRQPERLPSFLYGLPSCLRGCLYRFRKEYIRFHSYGYPVPFLSGLSRR